MRPIALTIEGLTSFRTPQEVDFSELDLFVITGPTGSGKTTILDSITFALYGRMARVDQHTRRDMISHGAASARVQLDFEVDGARYRVARRMPRTGAQRGSLDLVDGEMLRPLVEAARITDLNERVEEIVGLDFETFTRAVLLPQGRFAEFLSGDNAERRKILVQLLDLSRYDRVGQRARQEATAIEARMGERNRLLETTYADATPERLREAKAREKDAKGRLAQLQHRAAQGRDLQQGAAARTQRMTSLGRICDQLAETRDQLSALAERWPELETDLEASRAELAGATRAKEAAEKGVAAARAKLDATVREIGDLATLVRLEDATRSLGAEEETLRTLAAERTQLGGELKVALESKKRAEQAVGETTAKVTRAQTTLETATLSERAAAQGVTFCKLAARREALLQTRDKAADSLANASRRFEEAERELARLNEQHAAIALRHGLAVGDPCPVCLSPITAVPAETPEVDALLETARETAVAARSHHQAAQKEVAEVTADLRGCETALEEARVSAGSARPTSVADGEASHARAVEALNVAKAEVDAAGSAERAATGALTAAVQAIAVLEAKIAGTSTRTSEAEWRASKARVTLAGAVGEEMIASAATEIQRRQAILATANDALTKANDAAATALRVMAEAEKTNANVERTLGAFGVDVAAATATARTQCISLAGLLDQQMQLPAATIAPGEGVMVWCRFCEERLQSAAEVMTTLTDEEEANTVALRRLLEEAELETSGTVDEMLRILSDTVTTASHDYGVARTEVETVTARLAEREAFQEAVEEDRNAYELHHRLGNELAQNRFTQWLIDESLKLLAAQASIELRAISNDRYSLDASGGEFEVIDHANADERRSVSTLSGGETFLASLSLALALSLGLREIAGVTANRLEAMFIDEGFGALDEETLGVVIDALESASRGRPHGRRHHARRDTGRAHHVRYRG